MKVFGLVFLLMGACQTLPQTEDRAKKAELIEVQKSVVVSYLNRGMPQLALKELKELMLSNPDDADLLNLMGLSHLALGQPQSAAEFFRQASELKARPAVSLNLSSALIESGETLKALSLLQKLDKDPETQSYLYPERIKHNLGLASEKAKRLVDAERYYRAALKQNPDFYMSLMRLAQLLDQTKRTKLSEPYYKRAYTVCSICFEPLNALYYKNLKEGKTAEADKLLRSFIAQREVSETDRGRAKKLSQMLDRLKLAKKSKAR